MNDYIEIDLLPKSIKSQMQAIKTVSFCVTISAVAFLIALWCFGCFDTTTTGILFSIMILCVFIPMLLPSILYYKTSQSSLTITDDHIYIRDKKGNCLRTINCNTITDIRIEEISDFFYGRNRHTFRFEYVCLFLNGNTQIPDVSFSKLFFEKDFIMFGYNEEALKRISLIHEQIRGFYEDS